MRKNNIVLRKFLPPDAYKLARTLRAEDRRELAASHPGQEPGALIRYFAQVSRCAFTLLHRGKVAAVCGIVAPYLLGARAQVWLLTGGEVEEIPKSFFACMRGLVAHFSGEYPELTVWVDSRYARALRLVGRLNFSAGPILMVSGVTFIEFIFRRKKNGRSH